MTYATEGMKTTMKVSDRLNQILECGKLENSHEYQLVRRMVNSVGEINSPGIRMSSIECDIFLHWLAREIV